MGAGGCRQGMMLVMEHMVLDDCPDTVDGLIQIGGQQLKWVSIKSRDCNQPVTCSEMR
jgi:hypothetical protein